MAFIEFYREKLQHNYQFLQEVFEENEIDWSIVTKILCGHPEYLQEVINLGIKEVCDARISNLETIKKLNPDINTVYIKPPSKSIIRDVVKYADLSFNTEFETIQWLSDEAQKQNKEHKVAIMIELGDLREGVMGEDLIDFYAKVFQLPNIKIVGLGANLNCLHGIMPSEDKLIQLSLYKQLIETKFNQHMPVVSGGTSVVIPLLFKKQVPKGINHFRVGEMLFFGNNLFTGDIVEGMHDDVFKLKAQIIEITEKPKVPIGMMEENPSGEMYEINEEDYGKTSKRAIIDVGLLDVAQEGFLIPEDPKVEIAGASSDMLVLDVNEVGDEYHVGDYVSFKLKYMGALRVFNSEYVDKKII
ncbi:alanine/ornithine racemase family PLP-dependent enzyme [Limibacter armeniacum]|uniref:alanine/ornithine racemase family PLP-dependent enzyme n=1 Tax=Limibacter armeniacum TaxID=466084 RepID=UPI002FE51B61